VRDEFFSRTLVRVADSVHRDLCGRVFYCQIQRPHRNSGRISRIPQGTQTLVADADHCDISVARTLHTLYGAISARAVDIRDFLRLCRFISRRTQGFGGLLSSVPKGLFKKVKSGWKKVTRKIVAVQTVIILGIAYFTVFALTSIFLKIFGKKMLPHFRAKDSSYWRPKEKIANTMDFLKRQF
jgi:hypothetical protein